MLGYLSAGGWQRRQQDDSSAGVARLTKVASIIREWRETRGLVRRRALATSFDHLGRKRKEFEGWSTSKSRNEGLGVGRNGRAFAREVRGEIFLPGVEGAQ